MLFLVIEPNGSPNKVVLFVLQIVLTGPSHSHMVVYENLLFWLFPHYLTLPV